MLPRWSRLPQHCLASFIGFQWQVETLIFLIKKNQQPIFAYNGPFRYGLWRGFQADSLACRTQIHCLDLVNILHACMHLHADSVRQSLQDMSTDLHSSMLASSNIDQSFWWFCRFYSGTVSLVCDRSKDAEFTVQSVYTPYVSIKSLCRIMD